MNLTLERPPEHLDARAEALGIRRLRRLILLGLVLLAGSAWLLSPTLRTELSVMVEMTARGRVDALGDRFASYGLLGPLISLGIMVLQGILAPLPAFVVTFANGLAFGTFWGWVISLAGHVLASSVAFFLASRLGRTRVQALMTKKGLNGADEWLERWGPQAVFLTRLAPGISFDAISYAAGLTRIRFKHFVIATTLGVIPETLLFAYLGHTAEDKAPLVMGIAFAAAVVGVIATVVVGRRRRVGD
jgi:uncharacterized membrane protein YdjX (TVP38/TMEM64 family)